MSSWVEVSGEVVDDGASSSSGNSTPSSSESDAFDDPGLRLASMIDGGHSISSLRELFQTLSTQHSGGERDNHFDTAPNAAGSDRQHSHIIYDQYDGSDEAATVIRRPQSANAARPRRRSRTSMLASSHDPIYRPRPRALPAQPHGERVTSTSATFAQAHSSIVSSSQVDDILTASSESRRPPSVSHSRSSSSAPSTSIHTSTVTSSSATASMSNSAAALSMVKTCRFLPSPLGREVTLQREGTVAVRNRAEYMDSIAFVHPPLAPDSSNSTHFGIRVMETQSSWSGTIKLGITAIRPNDCNVNGVHPEDFPQSWVFQPSKLNVLCREGDTFRVELRMSPDAQGEGNFVLVRNNEAVATIFEQHVPPHPLYGVVELYGQCVSVVVEDVRTALDLDYPMIDDMVTRSAPAMFNSTVIGRQVRLAANNTVAERVGSFMESIVFTEEPVHVPGTPFSYFEIEVLTLQRSWSGSLKLGLTNQSPNNCQDLVNLNLSEFNTVWSLDTDPLPIRPGDILRVEFSEEGTGGTFSLYNNMQLVSETKKADLPRGAPWYGIFELYGKCSGIRIISSTASSLVPISVDDLNGMLAHDRLGLIARAFGSKIQREAALKRRFESSLVQLEQTHREEIRRLESSFRARAALLEQRHKLDLERLEQHFDALAHARESAEQELRSWEEKLNAGRVDELDEGDIVLLFARLGVPIKPEAIYDNHVTGSIFLELVDGDLTKSLGIDSFGHRKRLLHAIDLLNHGQVPPLLPVAPELRLVSGSQSAAESEGSSQVHDGMAEPTNATGSAQIQEGQGSGPADADADAGSDADADADVGNSQTGEATDVQSAGSEDAATSKASRDDGPDVTGWTSKQVAAALSHATEILEDQAAAVAKLFQANDIDGFVLKLLTRDDLRDGLGITNLVRLSRVQRAVNRLRGFDLSRRAAGRASSTAGSESGEVADADSDVDAVTPVTTTHQLNNEEAARIVQKLVESNRHLRRKLESAREQRREGHDIPPEFVCPITRAIMEDPVIAHDGHAYERAAIEAWFAAGNSTSPVTRASIPQTVIPAFSIKNHIKRYLAGDA